MSTNEEKSIQTQSVGLETSEVFFDMTPQMQRFVQLYLTGQYTLAKLAELLEVHPNTVSGWLRRDDVKESIQSAQHDIHHQVGTQLKSLTLKATRRLHDLVDSPIDAVALQAVKDVLDRSGHKAKQEIKVEKTVTTIEQKMKELMDSTLFVEAEFEEVDDGQGSVIPKEDKD